MDEARERNSKGHLVYKKAYHSMKACPTRFQHASEAEQLNGIGPKLCTRLNEKHIVYCNDNGLPAPKKPSRRNRGQVDGAEGDQGGNDDATEEQPTKKRKVKEYVPKLRSGAYALVKALGELDREGLKAMSKKDLIDRAQPYCDSNFTTPSEPGKFYTAWKSMDTLLAKELVCTRGHPTKRYQLTDEGWNVAVRMQNEQGGAATAVSATAKKGKTAESSIAKPKETSEDSGQVAANDVVDIESDAEPQEQCTPLPKRIPIQDSGPSARRTSAVASTNSAPIVLQPGTFDVKLVLDTREVRTKTDRDYIANELKKYDVVADIRALPLGDILWIAKLKPGHAAAFQYRNAGDDDEGSDEIVLEHIIERKRLDDLVSSIKDGRFHEQKFRLKRSGMRHVTYVVETVTLSAERQDLYGQSIESALASMQIVDDIFLKQTAKMDETIKYLARMTMSLKSMYEQKPLHVLPSRTLDVSTHHTTLDELRSKVPANAYCITFSAFCSLCDKSDSLTLRDLYLKMLMCMRGVTGDKAIEIQKIWPTPNALIQAYNELGSDQKAKELLVSNRLGKEIDRKQVGKVLSAKIAEVWAG